MRVLYFAQIQSILMYVIVIRGSMSKQSDINSLQKIQDDCMRSILPKKSVSETYKQLQVLPIKKIIALEKAKMGYKLCNDMLPKKLTETLLTDQNDMSIKKSHKYGTRKKHIPNHPSANSTTYHNSFLYNAISSYSALPSDISKSKTLHCFVASCKKHLQNKD